MQFCPQCLVKTALVDDGTLEAQLNVMEATRSRCALNKITLEDWQYATLLLLNLPESYKHISNSFLTNNKIDKLSPATVIAKHWGRRAIYPVGTL